jgi:hypothetical protein
MLGSVLGRELALGCRTARVGQGRLRPDARRYALFDDLDETWLLGRTRALRSAPLGAEVIKAAGPGDFSG